MSQLAAACLVKQLFKRGLGERFLKKNTYDKQLLFAGTERSWLEQLPGRAGAFRFKKTIDGESFWIKAKRSKVDLLHPRSREKLFLHQKRRLEEQSIFLFRKNRCLWCKANSVELRSRHWRRHTRAMPVRRWPPICHGSQMRFGVGRRGPGKGCLRVANSCCSSSSALQNQSKDLPNGYLHTLYIAII